MTRLLIVECETKDIKTYNRHSRKFGREAIAKMVNAIKEFGFRTPLLVKGDGELIDGHLRLAAALKLNMKVLPVIAVDDLSDEKICQLRLMLNRSSTWAQWDDEVLALEIGEMHELGLDLTLSGFDVAEIDELLKIFNNNNDKDPDDFVDEPVDQLASPGELWRLGDHYLLCGDSTSWEDCLRLTGGRPMDAVWTDPPYNVNYEGQAGKIMNDNMKSSEFEVFLGKVFKNMFQLMCGGSPFYIAFADSETKAFRGGLSSTGFKIASCLIWLKNNIVMGRSDYQWRHEPLLYGWKPGGPHPWYGGRKQSTVLEDLQENIFNINADGTYTVVAGDSILHINGENLTVESSPATIMHLPKPAKSKLHPTTKPVELIERCLKNSSKPGDNILDLFGGSGSTLIACERLGRKAFIMEKDPRYASVIIQRWQEFTGGQANMGEVSHA